MHRVGSDLREVHTPDAAGVLIKLHDIRSRGNVPQLDDPIIVCADQAGLDVPIPAERAQLGASRNLEQGVVCWHTVIQHHGHLKHLHSAL